MSFERSISLFLMQKYEKGEILEKVRIHAPPEAPPICFLTFFRRPGFAVLSPPPSFAKGGGCAQSGCRFYPQMLRASVETSQH